MGKLCCVVGGKCGGQGGNSLLSTPHLFKCRPTLPHCPSKTFPQAACTSPIAVALWRSNLIDRRIPRHRCKPLGPWHKPTRLCGGGVFCLAAVISCLCQGRMTRTSSPRALRSTSMGRSQPLRAYSTWRVSHSCAMLQLGCFLSRVCVCVCACACARVVGRR